MKEVILTSIKGQKDTRFGDYVKALIKEKGKTLNETARAIGVHSSRISEVLNGLGSPFDEPKLSVLASYLNLTTKEMEKMYDLEGLLKKNIPSDVNTILMQNPEWISLIRRVASLSAENQIKFLVTMMETAKEMQESKPNIPPVIY